MKLHSVQAARAVAAWLVIVDHTLLELTNNDSASAMTHLAWALGNMGVYLFFAISGFIMVHISWESFGRRGTASNFLQRRIIRIVPLYWLATVAAFAYHKVSATHGSHAGFLEIFYSFTFIPHLDEDGVWAPVLPQGWTLSYEMMFYGVFALALLLPRRSALPAAALTLGALVALGPLQPSATVAYMASPIVLWFLPGIAAAMLVRRTGFAEPLWLARSSRALEPFGDASYSTYLAHGVVLTVVLRIWERAIGAPSLWILPISLILATLAGLVIHSAVERPVLRVAAALRFSGRAAAANLEGARRG